MGVKITSDLTRQLPSKNFEEGSQISIDIPRDSVFKHLQLRISGSVVTTFASGTPVSDDSATLDRIVNSIDIVSNGSFTIKNVTPWMMQQQSLMATSNFGVRKAVAGAVAPVGFNPTADGKFVYGTTTQISTVVETILISFENVMAGEGRMSTLWDTRGLASAEMKISTNSFSNLTGFGNTAPVVYSANTMNFQVSTVETQDLPQNIFFSAWKQTTKSVGMSAQVSDFLVDINRGNFLQGIMIETRNGAAGTATTATGKVLNSNVLTNLKLILNGVNFIQNTSFVELQDKNRVRYGINAPFVANKSVLDGMAYLDLLTPARGEKFGALGTAQNVQAPQVDQVQLSISSSATTSYTNTATAKFMTNEIVKPVN